MSINKEELVKMSKDELRIKAVDLVTSYNEAMTKDSLSAVQEIEDDIAEVIKRYGAVSKDECFSALLRSDDPMLAAVKQLTYRVIKTKDVAIEGSKLKRREIVDAEKAIDLRDLHKKAIHGIGKNPQWVYAVEKMNCLMTFRVCKDLGINPKGVKDNYYMSDFAKQIDLGKTPDSNTAVLKLLTQIVAMMIGGEFKPVSKDVKYLDHIYSKKGKKALAVSCANHGNFTSYIAEICHRIVCNKVYDVEYKVVKR